MSLEHCSPTELRRCCRLPRQKIWRYPPHPPPSPPSSPAPFARLALNDIQSSAGTSAHPPLRPGRGHRWARETSRCGRCEKIQKNNQLLKMFSVFFIQMNQFWGRCRAGSGEEIEVLRCVEVTSECFYELIVYCWKVLHQNKGIRFSVITAHTPPFWQVQTGLSKPTFWQLAVWKCR